MECNEWKESRTGYLCSVVLCCVVTYTSIYIYIYHAYMIQSISVGRTPSLGVQRWGPSRCTGCFGWFTTTTTTTWFWGIAVRRWGPSRCIGSTRWFWGLANIDTSRRPVARAMTTHDTRYFIDGTITTEIVIRITLTTTVTPILGCFLRLFRFRSIIVRFDLIIRRWIRGRRR